MELTVTCSIFHANTKEYTFSSATQVSSAEMDHILGHKAKLYKFKKIKVTSYSLFEDNTIKLTTNSKQISNKYTSSWRLNSSLLDDEWVKVEIKTEMRNSLEECENNKVTPGFSCSTLVIFLLRISLSVSKCLSPSGIDY